MFAKIIYGTRKPLDHGGQFYLNDLPGVWRAVSFDTMLSNEPIILQSIAKVDQPD
jgi:hypothetical protein